MPADFSERGIRVAINSTNTFRKVAPAQVLAPQKRHWGCVKRVRRRETSQIFHRGDAEEYSLRLRVSAVNLNHIWGKNLLLPI